MWALGEMDADVAACYLEPLEQIRAFVRGLFNALKTVPERRQLASFSLSIFNYVETHPHQTELLFDELLTVTTPAQQALMERWITAKPVASANRRALDRLGLANVETLLVIEDADEFRILVHRTHAARMLDVVERAKRCPALAGVRVGMTVADA